MARARIYRPAKNAMQSGRANTKFWVLNFVSTDRQIDPLMGWTSSPDTKPQIELQFETKEAAIAYATKHDIDYQLVEPKTQRLSLKTYADNFKADRDGQWTH